MSHANLIVTLDGTIPEDEVEREVDFQMVPFSEHEWFGDGSRWDWYVIGGRWNGWNFGGENIIRRGDLNLQAIYAHKRSEYEQNYAKAMTEFKAEGDVRTHVYGVLPEHTTVKQYLDHKMKNLVSAYAFLQDREWHENERMGWFACPTATECEQENKDHQGKCIFTHEDMEARIYAYKGSDDWWSGGYFDRFIKPLSDNTWLVTVDYHV